MPKNYNVLLSKKNIYTIEIGIISRLTVRGVFALIIFLVIYTRALRNIIARLIKESNKMCEGYQCDILKSGLCGVNSSRIPRCSYSDRPCRNRARRPAERFVQVALSRPRCTSFELWQDKIKISVDHGGEILHSEKRWEKNAVCPESRWADSCALRAVMMHRLMYIYVCVHTARVVSSIFLTFLKIGRSKRVAITNPFGDDT